MSEQKKENWKKIVHAPLFMPLVCLTVVLLVNILRTPDFFYISIKNGVLYGYLIDIINRGSELVILAVGMITAFVVSILAIKFLMGYIKKHDFKVFGYYRIILGIAVVAYFMIAG